MYFAVTMGEYLQYGLIALGGFLILTAITIGLCSEKKPQSVSKTYDSYLLVYIITSVTTGSGRMCWKGSILYD